MRELVFQYQFYKKLLLATYGLVFVAICAAEQSPTLDLKSFAIKKMQDHKLVGAAIGTIKNGQVDNVFYLGFESTATKEPVTKKSVFQVGSISKPVAAWTVMTLVRDQKLDLDKPIHQYLRRWKLPESNFNNELVTLRQLLSHTAGLRLSGYPGFPIGQSLPTLEESLSGKTNGAGNVELFQKPGTGYSYSGGGYTLIQLLVEEVSGMSFSDYAELAVFEPLGMLESSYDPSKALLQRRIQPHGASGRPISQHNFRAQAAAALHTTVIDLMHFVVANLSENEVLTPSAISTMHSPVADAGFADIGLGFFIRADGRLLGHGGANFGWRAEIQFDHQSRDGLVVMTNSEGAGHFLADLKCGWDARRAEPLISKQCSERKSQAELTSLLILLIAFVLLVFVSVLIWALLTSRLELALPRTKIKFIGLLLLVSLTLFSFMFMYTPLGVYLVAGFNSISATIHYAPLVVIRLTPWIFALLLAAWFPFFLVRAKKDEVC